MNHRAGKRSKTSWDPSKLASEMIQHHSSLLTLAEELARLQRSLENLCASFEKAVQPESATSLHLMSKESISFGKTSASTTSPMTSDSANAGRKGPGRGARRSSKS